LVVTGRGYSYPTAREGALKLMETAYLSAQAFSGADLLPGPPATIDTQVPVLAAVAHAVGRRTMDQVLPRLAGHGGDLTCVGTAEAVAGANAGVVLPTGLPEDLSPLLEILPLQQIAHRLAVARGVDPDAPRSLSKVTETL